MIYFNRIRVKYALVYVADTIQWRDIMPYRKGEIHGRKFLGL